MKKILLALAFVGVGSLVQAQFISDKEVDNSYKPLTLKLSEDGKKHIRFIMWHQIWATTNNFNTDGNFQADVSMRRSRFLAYAQISPRFLILTHFGLNNMNAGNMTSLGNNGDSPQMFLHDAWGEVKINKHLFVGGGLHYWKGLTRLANQSTLNFMTLDNSRPFVHWHSLGITDQFARHLGVYAKGDIGKLEYRIAVNNPLNPANALGAGVHFGDIASEFEYTGSANPEANGDATANTIVEGYFKFDLLDKESMKLPYYVGTFFGKKKLLSIGTGFFSHANGMYNVVDSAHRDVLHLAGDVFFDHPAPGGGINAYASYQHFDYGQNYMSRWAGTGDVFYGQVGYYLDKLKIMPYVSGQYAQFDGMQRDPSAFNAGVNYFINGHFAKLTLEYHAISNNILEGGLDQNGNPNGIQQIRFQAHFFL